MSTGSASPEGTMEMAGPAWERLTQYRAFAALFGYPNDAFFAMFPGYAERRGEIEGAYDRLFRAGGVWLFGAEHLVANEFQRARQLADIVGFYLAFGVEPDRERADALTTELEFMHFLIFKAQLAKDQQDGEAKARLCEEAQRAFFFTHLYPAACKIIAKLQACEGEGFYGEAAVELGLFLATEQQAMTKEDMG